VQVLARNSTNLPITITDWHLDVDTKLAKQHRRCEVFEQLAVGFEKDHSFGDGAVTSVIMSVSPPPGGRRA
jgi:hypothetical protein